jgi:hypothetical protein
MTPSNPASHFTFRPFLRNEASVRSRVSKLMFSGKTNSNRLHKYNTYIHGAKRVSQTREKYRVLSRGWSRSICCTCSSFVALRVCLANRYWHLSLASGEWKAPSFLAGEPLILDRISENRYKFQLLQNWFEK